MKSPAAPARTCPCCRSRLQRVRRGFADRLLSLFVPVLRYRCGSATCGWEALLRRAPAPAGAQHVRDRLYLGRQRLDPSRCAPADEFGPSAR